MAPNHYPSGTVIGLFIGKAEDRWPGKAPSAIGKRAVDQPVVINEEGLAGDQQADLNVHGGPEKAIHHYASEHMVHWRGRFDDCESQFEPGCFGENVSSTGLDETNLCLGDTLKLGSAKVQICQGRQPCWKLNAHTGLKEMAFEFQKTGRTGWYYRVLEEGTVDVGDRIAVEERLHANWSVQRLIRARFDSRLDVAIAKELSEIPELSRSWRESFQKKSKVGFQENTDRRLKDPA